MVLSSSITAASGISAQVFWCHDGAVFLPIVSAPQSCQVEFLVFGGWLWDFFLLFFFSPSKQIASIKMNSNLLSIIGMNYFPAIKVLLQFLLVIFVVVFY